ncbi:unnamed protein product [Phytophthora fragariaefolia]|uniref:Unnamed protein product n=1 Tax=Phytophthora fragariaefolia TaxID=1490495 RepID=A0A9W6XF95_9STRA|nr:unnamed protein product [Phytophthora fragariaefolia]
MVSSVLPADSIRIWKRGAQLRIDSALKGLDGVKWKKGPMSHVFLGAEAHGARASHAVVLDHDSKRFYDVLEAMQHSSVENVDLALQVALTTAMSTSSMDTANLEFVKHKDVKAQGKRDDSRIHEDDEQRKSRRKQRKCPWPGTTYKMHNFSMEAQFRPVVKPNRKMKQPPNGKDTPFEEVQQFVDHLNAHGKEKKASKMKQKHSSSLSSGGDSVDGNTARTLRLEKGRKVEMHLDVIAGDTIKWEFVSKSSGFSFVATYFHEDQQQPVCRTGGVKNTAIAGAFHIEHNGSFVLVWQNTQKGFTIDRDGIKITYDVVHTRSAVDEPPANGVLTAASTGQDGLISTTLPEYKTATTDEPLTGNNLTDDQICEVFRQLDHIPNPITTTTSFVDYFKLGDASSEVENPVGSNQHGSKKKPSLFKMFEDKKRPQQPLPMSRDDGSEAAPGAKNTFRSLTLLPTARKMRKDFEAKVVMSENFPFQLRDFLPVIKFLSTTGDHVKNLDEFFQMVRLLRSVLLTCVKFDDDQRRLCLRCADP